MVQLEFVLAAPRSETAQIEFVLGPAGSGKTFGCLKAVRATLEEAPEGLPLIFIAPKQATYQLERQLLDYASEASSSFSRVSAAPR